ncbi:MAG: Gfo/Idh/MocA family protein [Bacteriovoracaceae bacterium]
MKITPFLIGSGMAGQAILKSLEVIKLISPELHLAPTVPLKRDQSLEGLVANAENAVLFIANPSALHASTILKAETVGFKTIVCEKPIATDLDQIELLKKVKARVAVLHGYRMMWGPQTIEKMLNGGEFGELISIESRFWQSSVAQKALSKAPERAPWKSDISLNGKYDVLLDLGSHWIDMITYLAADFPSSTEARLSTINALSPGRDTHLNLNLQFNNGLYATGSISKAVHGTGNSFEINILGAKKSCSWNFLNPDEIIIGEGAHQLTRKRTESSLGGKQNSFHGLGWIDGHIEVIHQILMELNGKKGDYPNLEVSLKNLESLLKAKFI